MGKMVLTKKIWCAIRISPPKRNGYYPSSSGSNRKQNRRRFQPSTPLPTSSLHSVLAKTPPPTPLRQFRRQFHRRATALSLGNSLLFLNILSSSSSVPLRLRSSSSSSSPQSAVFNRRRAVGCFLFLFNLNFQFFLKNILAIILLNLNPKPLYLLERARSTFFLFQC